MAIVEMKKLRVMAMASQRDELLRGLLHLGCVEISEPDGKLADPAQPHSRTDRVTAIRIFKYFMETLQFG